MWGWDGGWIAVEVRELEGLENGENWGGKLFSNPPPPSDISRQIVRVKSAASSLFASNYYVPWLWRVLTGDTALTTRLSQYDAGAAEFLVNYMLYILKLQLILSYFTEERYVLPVIGQSS